MQNENNCEIEDKLDQIIGLLSKQNTIVEKTKTHIKQLIWFLVITTSIIIILSMTLYPVQMESAYLFFLSEHQQEIIEFMIKIRDK